MLSKQWTRASGKNRNSDWQTRKTQRDRQTRSTQRTATLLIRKQKPIRNFTCINFKRTSCCKLLFSVAVNLMFLKINKKVSVLTTLALNPFLLPAQTLMMKVLLWSKFILQVLLPTTYKFPVNLEVIQHWLCEIMCCSWRPWSITKSVTPLSSEIPKIIVIAPRRMEKTLSLV